MGYHPNSSGTDVTLAEVWNGTSWTLQTTPNPLGATGSGLDAVSCSSATACTAVGSYDNSSGTEVTLAEVWNGTSWTVQTTPNPSGATYSDLDAVSCSSPTACTAVGSYDNTPEQLAEVWNGTSWTVQTTPNPSGATGSSLYGVSCTSATACTAVGSYESGSGAPEMLAEAWNGTSWTVQTTPNPKGATISSFYGVSCSSATACTAVGYSENGTLAEVWNGTSWTVQTTPNPKGATISSFYGVSCSSATACTAVGFYYNPSGNQVMLAEMWNGTSWTVRTTPNPSGAVYSGLEAVSCSSATACTAVGISENSYFAGVTLAEVWNGSSWTVQTTPNPKGATDSGLEAVSCSSATACTAIGISDNKTLAEVWNGSSWTVQTTPNPKGAIYSHLEAVSCSSATACTAVGSYENSPSVVETLAEVWNGISWTLQATPNPSGAAGSDLDAVSCNSPTACTAVGIYKNSSGTPETLAEVWNGTSWTLQATPNPSGAIASSLYGVSCSSATACAAVGTYINSSNTEVTLAEVWNGISWTLQATPNPPGAIYSYLEAVSCRSATACTAVGFYDNSSGTEVTLAEVWNGSSWTVQATPNPSGAISSSLYGVSCSSATACTAVGFYDNNSGTEVTLAEVWKGTSWTVQAPPNPKGATDSGLEALSCSSATACTAVGFYDNSSGTDVTLAESEGP